MAGSSNNNFMNFIITRWFFWTNHKDIGTFPCYRMLGIFFSLICIVLGVSKIAIMKFCIAPLYASLNVNTIILILAIFIYAVLFSLAKFYFRDIFNFEDSTMFIVALVFKLLSFCLIYIGLKELVSNNEVMLFSWHAFITTKVLIFYQIVLVVLENSNFCLPIAACQPPSTSDSWNWNSTIFVALGFLGVGVFVGRYFNQRDAAEAARLSANRVRNRDKFSALKTENNELVARLAQVEREHGDLLASKVAAMEREHGDLLASRLVAMEREHGEVVASMAAGMEHEHCKVLASNVAAMKREHGDILASKVAAMEREHIDVLSSALKAHKDLLILKTRVTEAQGYGVEEIAALLKKQTDYTDAQSKYIAARTKRLNDLSAGPKPLEVEAVRTKGDIIVETVAELLR